MKDGSLEEYFLGPGPLFLPLLLLPSNLYLSHSLLPVKALFLHQHVWNLDL